MSTRRVERVGAWDRVPVPAHESDGVAVIDDEQRRWLRFGRVEAAMAGSLSETELEALREELKTRREFWEKRTLAWTHLPRIGPVIWGPMIVVGLYVVPMLAAMAPVRTAVVIASLGVSRLAAGVLRCPSAARLRSRQCADCAYQLSLETSRSAIGELSAGPETCPECGSVWPLVPPPVPR